MVRSRSQQRTICHQKVSGAGGFGWGGSPSGRSLAILSKLQNQVLLLQKLSFFLPIVQKNTFQSITACEGAADTNCFVSWRTYKEGFTPNDTKIGNEISVANPLNWNSQPQLIGQESHKGAVLRNFNKVFRNIVEARIYNGMLWTNKPKFPLSFLFNRKNYHVVDMNFFYVDIQENAIERTEAFLDKNGDWNL